MDRDFVSFCHQASDSQLEHLLAKEFNGSRSYSNYEDALVEARVRGWEVEKGRRI